MSTAMVAMADPPRMAIRIAITTKVYGRLRASLTIHIGSFWQRPQRPVRTPLQAKIEVYQNRYQRPLQYNGRHMDSRDPTAAQLKPNAQVGPYRIEERIGSGGMGEVFRALDVRLGRKVAIKMSTRPFDSRFEREARAISALNHPHICTLYDI